MLKRLLILAIAALILAGALLYSQIRREPLHVSGFIEAHEVRVGSRVGGRIAEVPAKEGDHVKKGDILLRLEPFDLLQRQAEAAAQLAAKQADYDRLTKGYRPEEIGQSQARRDQISAKLEALVAGPRKQEISTSEAHLILAQTQLKIAQSNHTRVKNAFETHSASQDDFDRAADTLNVAEANLRVRQQELDLLKEGTRKEDLDQARAQLAEAEQSLAMMKTGYRVEDIAAAKAAAQAAQAAADAIAKQVEELTVRAPLDGTLEAVEIRPGDLVNPGAPALTLLDTSELWVRTYVPENHMNLTDGQAVRITVDSLPKNPSPAASPSSPAPPSSPPATSKPPKNAPNKSSASKSPSTPPTPPSAPACPPTCGLNRSICVF